MVPVWWTFNKWQFMGTYLLIDAFSASTCLSPHQHCWREPCNNLPCFHDNHLLLSSPHLSTSPSLPCFPLFLPLSVLPSLCTLLVFQGQTRSQPESEIETEIGVESGERRAITIGKTADRGGLEDKNPPDIVIVSTLDLRQLSHSAYLGLCSLIITLFLVQIWPTTCCILPGFKVAVVASLIFPATWAE